jgi:hypothetical protein
MINIQNTKTFRYDQDRSTVTVYGDFDDPNKWYIEPAISFARQMVDGVSLPSFSLTEYNTNEGIQGTCNFTTELTVSPEALQAVYDNLGHGITIGQFDWVNAQAFFMFQVGGEEYTINAVPSRYASNRAAFVLHLPNQEWVNTFKTAFGPGQGSVSPFRAQYDVLALSKLPAVDVTVKYNSQIAFDYEKTVNVNKNVWGKETSRRETIKEQLKNSDAGDTIVNWNVPNPSPELQQRVLDWAWVTLEGLVQRAVDDAVRFVGEKNADKINMSATSSFERRYSENQVIEWSVIPFVQLPAFSQEEWSRLYSKAENRNLAVAFTVRDSLKNNDIQYVEVTVRYPTKLTGNTFVFDQNGPTTWNFEADGTNPFNPVYEYKYKVQFAEPGNSYESPWVSSADTTVVLPLTALGIQKAVFIGSNINFDDVDFVLIDFFYNLPNGVNKHEQRKMVDNVTPIEIASRSFLPSTNEYTYQLTYVMKDKRVVQVASRRVFPPQNSDLVTIFSPFQETMFSIGVINPSGASTLPSIRRVQVTGRYDDPQNSNTQSHQWSFTVPTGQEYTEGEPWTIDVIDNPAGAFIEYSGSLILSNGRIRQLSKVRNQWGFINLSYLETPFTVEVDPFQVDWAGGVTMVQVDLFTLEGNPIGFEAISRGIENRTFIESQAFMRQKEGAVPKQYYTFNAPVGEALVYYYQVTYFHESGPDTYVTTTPSQTQLIVLPKDGDSVTPQFLRIEVEALAVEELDEAVA